jgi:diphosphomevalonate decarboxylase
MFQKIKEKGLGRAPINIALIKYWGKRDHCFNLPLTDSISIALPFFTKVEISLQSGQDEFYINEQILLQKSPAYQRLVEFLDLFRPSSDAFFLVKSISDVAVAAGLASSAAFFAALSFALNDLFDWNLDHTMLSIIARLGSGSACRSVLYGMVYWHRGIRDDGLDSISSPVHSIHPHWNNLYLGLIMIDDKEKSLSSRKAMEYCVNTSALFPSWSDCVANDIKKFMVCLEDGNMNEGLAIAQNNALSMHGLMLSSRPGFSYIKGKTMDVLQQLFALQQDIPIYATMDAGPNIKLLFHQNKISKVQSLFPTATIIPALWS